MLIDMCRQREREILPQTGNAQEFIHVTVCNLNNLPQNVPYCGFVL